MYSKVLKHKKCSVAEATDVLFHRRCQVKMYYKVLNRALKRNATFPPVSADSQPTRGW